MYERIKYNLYDPEYSAVPDQPVLDDIAHILTGTVLVEPLPIRESYFTRRQGAAVLALMPELSVTFQNSRFSVPSEQEFNARQDQFALGA